MDNYLTIWTVLFRGIMDSLLGKFFIINENNGFPSKFPSSYPSRAAVIIDGGYWRKLVENLNITNVDLVKLTDKISAPAYRFRTIFFDGKNQDNQSFHDSLRLLDRFEVFLGDVMPRDITCPHCSKRFSMDTQKRVDVALAVEIVHLATAKHVDLITLIAGDRDFLPAIETAKHAGVIIRLAHGPISTVSDIMLQSVDERIEINIDYLENTGINFDDVQIEFPTTLLTSNQLKQVVANERSDVEIKAIEELLVSLLKNLIQKTSKNEFAYSFVGSQLNKLEPNWKELYHVKHLKDLVSIAKSQVISTRKEHDTFLSLQNKEITTTIQNKADSAKSFIITTIQEYYNTGSSLPLTVSYLGWLLANKDYTWKKRFKIKSLSQVLAEYTDKITITNLQNKQIITLI